MKTRNLRNTILLITVVSTFLIGGCKDKAEESAPPSEEETGSTPSKVEKPESEEETNTDKAKEISDVRDRRLKRTTLDKKENTKRLETPKPPKTTNRKDTTTTEKKDKTTKAKVKVKEADPKKEALARANTLASISPQQKEKTPKARPAREKPPVIPAPAKTTKRPTLTTPAVPSRPQRPPLAISNGLHAKELTQLTGKTFREVSLAGQEPSPNYNVIRFNQDSKHYGVSVQVWQETQLRDTRARYENMKTSYPNVSVTGNVTSDTFFAHWGSNKKKLYYLVFMELKKRKVISVTADSTSLEPNQLFVIATRVRDRLLSSSRRR
jgi:hypothetical protein